MQISLTKKFKFLTKVKVIKNYAEKFLKLKTKSQDPGGTRLAFPVIFKKIFYQLRREYFSQLDILNYAYFTFVSDCSSLLLRLLRKAKETGKKRVVISRRLSSIF